MRFFIKDYVDKIKVSDIINFASSNNIELLEDEASILNGYLKNNWEELLYGNPLPIIQKIEKKFGKTKSKQIVDLFYFYKQKYKNYL